MGDDGVGVAAIEALQRRGVPSNVELMDAGLAVSDVLGSLDPTDPLIVIDALRTGGEAGTIYKARLEDLSLREGSLSAAISLHELSVLPALRMEAMTGRRFTHVTVFGVEPEQVAWGEGLSPSVEQGLEKLVESILDHVRKLTQEHLVSAGDTSQ